MDPVPLANGQFDIDGFVFGTRDIWYNPNPYLVLAFQVTPGTLSSGAGGNQSSGSGTTTTPDATLPSEDGTKFGRDFNTGMLLSLSLAVWQRGTHVYDQIGALKGLWRDRRRRNVSNAVTALRMCVSDRTRLVYGRPRNFKETYGAVEHGWAPIDCDFQCADEMFYDDVLHVQDIGMQNPPVDGLVFPNTLPFMMAQFQENYTTVHVDGDYETWPMFVIHGPVTNPTIQYDNTWTITLLTSIDHTQTITIDPRPWYRQTRLSGAGLTNLSGAYTQDSPVMREMRFAPGQHTVLYGGLDPSLTSYLTVSWRAAYGSP